LRSFYIPLSHNTFGERLGHNFKAHAIAGQMFEDKYDLAMAVIQGMETRSEAGGYLLERFRFNSA
jgi:hypothetical protein